MDAPRDGATCGREPVLVGGWAIDPEGRVRAVDLVVNGVVLETVPVRHERPDIGEHFTEYGEALHSGWTAKVDMSRLRTDRVILEAWAIRSTGERIQIASAGIELEDVVREDDGSEVRWISGPSSGGGYQRYYGVASVPGGVARVEARLDGVPVGAARIILPGRVTEPRAAVDVLGAFEIVCDVGAGPAERELGATVIAADGSSHELRVLKLTVAAGNGPGLDREWLATMRDRSLAHARFDVRPPAGAPMSVLVFTHDLSLGGGQLYLQELLLRLGRRGIDLTIVSMADGVLRAELEAAGHPVHVTGEYPVGSGAAYEGRVAEALSWAASEPRRFDAVIANTMLVYPGVDIAQRMGLPVVWAIHESFELDQFWMEAYPPGALDPYVRGRAELALAQANHVVFEAAATLELYAPHIREGAGAVVPYGVDVSEIDAYRVAHDRTEVRARLGFSDDDVVLLCLGTLEPRKAQAMLAHALSGIDEERARLVLVGARPGPYLDAIEEFLELADEHRVRIEPIVSDTNQWYMAADVFVCASDVESLPRSILEAMMFDTPVLSTAVFGIPELLEDGSTGYLCEHRDVHSLRRRMQEVLALTEVERREVGMRGGALVRNRHHPDVYVDAFERRLTSLVEAVVT